MEDLRRQKSKLLLKDAFWSVLRDKPYLHITIADIIKEAGVNRKTFYAYYQGVEELMRACLTDLFVQALLPYGNLKENDAESFARAQEKFAEFVQSRRASFTLIFRNHLDGEALRIWKSLYYATNYRLPGGEMQATNPKDPAQDLYYNYSTYASWGNFLWIYDHAELPVETLVQETLAVFRLYMADCDKLLNTTGSIRGTEQGRAESGRMAI